MVSIRNYRTKGTHPDVNGFTLLLPGKVIDISAVCKAKNFKDKGNKPAAIEACRRLEEEGLGTLHELRSLRGIPMLNILQPSELSS